MRMVTTTQKGAGKSKSSRGGIDMKNLHDLSRAFARASAEAYRRG
jgi:hypothetical protein